MAALQLASKAEEDAAATVAELAHARNGLRAALDAQQVALKKQEEVDEQLCSIRAERDAVAVHVSLSAHTWGGSCTGHVILQMFLVCWNLVFPNTRILDHMMTEQNLQRFCSPHVATALHLWLCFCGSHRPALSLHCKGLISGTAYNPMKGF